MDRVSRFYEEIKKEMGVTLATAAQERVTMRTVSPVYYKGDILIFTAPDSLKYRQLKENPNCCIAAGNFFAEARAEFLGATMAEANEERRNAYCEKFPGAFDEGVAMGGRDAEFIQFRLKKLTGWAYENDVPGEDGIPTIPFEIEMG